MSKRDNTIATGVLVAGTPILFLGFCLGILAAWNPARGWEGMIAVLGLVLALSCFVIFEVVVSWPFNVRSWLDYHLE